MGAKLEQVKASPSGKKTNSKGSQLLANVIAVVGSYLKGKRPVRYVVSVPKGRAFGKAFYAVEPEHAIVSMTFTKKKDAEAFQKLLKVSTREMQSDIVRREITDDGYCL